ncbi:hypothetical protein GCM10009838_61630 [Catenulispora subtropica]|uniref:Uncharacterized protein n=1 Tax=Catenulispora subtropica TaxID=450798 RepID=A0ABN2SPL9_9ACTN
MSQRHARAGDESASVRVTDGELRRALPPPGTLGSVSPGDVETAVAFGPAGVGRVNDRFDECRTQRAAASVRLMGCQAWADDSSGKTPAPPVEDRWRVNPGPMTLRSLPRRHKDGRE